MVGSSREKSYVIERDARMEAVMVDNAEKGGVQGLLTSTNLLYGPHRVQAVVDRIERQPDWIDETARSSTIRATGRWRFTCSAGTRRG